MLKVGLIAGAVLLGVIGLVLVTGFLLPKEHVAVATATYPESREHVFHRDIKPANVMLDSGHAVVSDFGAQTTWRGTVSEMRRLADRNGRPVWLEVAAHGKTPFEVTDLETPSRLLTTIVSDGLPYGGTWEYTLESVPEGTRVTITERGVVYNPIFRFVSRFIIGHHATASAYLTDLGKRFEVEVAVQKS